MHLLDKINGQIFTHIHGLQLSKLARLQVTWEK